MGTLTNWMAVEGKIIFKKYFDQGLAEGRAEERQKELKILTDNLIKRSDGKLSKEEALLEAKSLLMIK